MKSKNYTFFIFPIIILVLYIYQFLKIDVNLDSIFDEGFIFLKQQTSGIDSVDKGSLFPLIINKLLGIHITSNLLYLRYARYFIHLLSVILFSVISGWYLYKKGILDTLEKKVLYPFIIFLLGYISLGGIVISYNILQEFFLIIIIGSFLVATVTTIRKSFFLFVLIGFFFFFSILTILPSGLLVLACVLVLIGVKCYKEWKIGLICCLGLFVGILLSVFVFNYFILDVRIIYVGISDTAQSITTLNRGYDPFSFILKILLYLRDFYMAVCFMSGILLISLVLQKYTNRWVAIFVFLSSMLIISVYQKKPEIVLTSFLAFPMIVLLGLILKETSNINWKKLFSFKIMVVCFLFFLPLISSIGTNVYLGGKMGSFILPWGVLLMELMNNETIKMKYSREIRFIFWLFFLFIVFQPIQSIANDIKNYNHEKFYFDKEKPISQIQISKEQKTYFENVYAIMKGYHYQQNDVIFSTQLDLMTIVTLDGTPCGLFFQPMDFLAFRNKKSLKKPDFLFLNEFDLKLMSDTLQSLDWNFPDDYDQYFVGTPETMMTEYSTTRTLYCLKSRKNK